MSMFTPPANHSCKFQNVGDTYTGEITEIGERVQATEFGTDQPSFWDREHTRPKMQVKITLQTDQRDSADPNDDGKRGLWVVESWKKGGMLAAIGDAIRAAGADDLKVGGRLEVRFTGHDPESKNPANPRKMYQARYTAPAAGGGMFGGAGQQTQQAAPVQQQAAPAQQAPADDWPATTTPAPAQPQTQAAPAAPAAPAAGPDGPTAAMISGLISQGYQDGDIDNALANPAVTTETVAALRQQAA